MKIIWNVAAGAETRLAMAAALAVRAGGVDVEFATAFEASARLLRQNDWPVTLLDASAMAAVRVDDAAVAEIDRLCPQPGVRFLAFSEARVRRDDSQTEPLYAITARSLMFWRRLLDERRPDALVCWQSASLATRAPLSAARSLGIQTLIFTNGPTFGRVAIADIDESENWTELDAMLANAGSFELDDAARKMAFAHIREITEVHGTFKPRKISLVPDWAMLKGYIRSHLAAARNGADTPIERIQWRQHWQQVWWKGRLKLGLLQYHWLDPSERYVYFPMQNMSDVKLTGRNPVYADQIALAEQIALSMRPGLTLYVREHPNHPGMYDNTRLKRLLRHNLVKLIHPYESNIELIKKAAAVVCVNSTAGWEAYVNCVPLILLGNPYVRRSPLVFGVENLNDLSATIRRAVDEGPSLYRERQKEWLWFIYAALASCAPGHSFGYKEIFGSLPKQELSSNGRAVGEALLGKLRRLSASRRGERAVREVRL
jgi:hypothetical protein